MSRKAIIPVIMSIIAAAFGIAALLIFGMRTYAEPDVPDSTGNDVAAYIDSITPDHIEGQYTGTVYEGELPVKDCVKVRTVYKDGHSDSVASYKYAMPTEVSDSYTILIRSDYGNVNLEIAVVPLKDVEIAENIVMYEGRIYEDREADAYHVFENGAKKRTKAHISGGLAARRMSLTAKTPLKTIEFAPDIIEFDSFAMSRDGEDFYYEGETVVPQDLFLSYKDGTTEVISKDDIDWAAIDVLQAGDNEITFSLYGNTYTSVIHATPINAATDAQREKKDEIEKALYTHMSDTLFITVRRFSMDDKSSFYLSHIITAGPENVVAGLSYDTYGGTREKATDAAERNGWALCVNASNFSYTTGKADHQMGNIVIKNGEIMSDSEEYADGREICLKSDGTFFSPVIAAPASADDDAVAEGLPNGMTAQDMIEAGVTDTFICGDAVLIADGVPVNIGLESNQEYYPRTAIGMVAPGEYYIITAGIESYREGMSYTQIRDILTSLNCIWGKCMDGGGSVSLVLDGEMINPPSAGGERAVIDFIAFKD